MTMKYTLLSSIIALGLAGCASNENPYVPQERYTGTVLDGHAITARSERQFLQVDLNAEDSQLRRDEVKEIEGFLARYIDHGHGPLLLSVPANGENEEIAIQAVVEARDMAWGTGVNYEDMVGMAYDATGQVDAPMILAFDSYKAVKPQCMGLGAYDIADAKSNSALPSLGCAIRSNMAAMIADPADLLGERPLDEGSLDRRIIQFDLYREGAATAAERTGEESATISSTAN